MEKEDLQNSQPRTKGSGTRDQQKNQTTNSSNDQSNDQSLRAGLGRDLMMTDIEDVEGITGRENLERDLDDDLNNENLNASNDQ